MCKAFVSITSNDAMTMAALSGRRDVGLWLIDEIAQADIDGLYMMKKEADGREYPDTGS